MIPQYLYKFLCSLGFGMRPLGFADFEKACDFFGIKYFLVDEKIEEGLTFPRTRNGKKYKIIILKRTLFQSALTDVAWHEFGHAYLEHYGVRLFVRGSEDRAEQQADDFSLVCMIPTLWVRTRTREELLDEGFTNQQIDRRYFIYRKSGENL